MTRTMAILMLAAACGAGVCAGCGADDGEGPAGDPPDNFTAITAVHIDPGVCPDHFPIRDANTAPKMYDAPMQVDCVRSGGDGEWIFTCDHPTPVGGSVTIHLTEDAGGGSVDVAYEDATLTQCNRTAAIVDVALE